MEERRRAPWLGLGVGVLVATACLACGGKDSTPPGPPQPIASWAYSGVDGPTTGGMSVLSDQCLGDALPLDTDGEPDCVFIRALYPHGTATAATLASCQACSGPGEAVVPSSVPVSSVSADLAGFDCLCAVVALPSSAACPPAGGFTASSPAAWCYTASEASCASFGQLEGIVFSPAASEGAALYGACFAAGTFGVVEAQ